MTITRLFSLLLFVPSAAMVLAGCASTAEPKSENDQRIGYVQGGVEQNVVRSNTGECVRAGTGARGEVAAECEPQKAAAPEPAPAPEPVAAAPEPQPVIERVYVGTDAYFEFNQATLQSDARDKLDKLVTRAKDGQEPSIEITGYADPIGSEQYNLDLSQRRADAVRAYLVEQGLPEQSIRIEARGETDPIVRCDKKQGKELIQCLQPDRRSDILYSALEERRQ